MKFEIVSGESAASIPEVSDILPKGPFDSGLVSTATGDSILSNATAAALGTDHSSSSYASNHYMAAAPPYYSPSTHYPSNNNVYSGMYDSSAPYSLSLPAPVEFTYVPPERDGSGGYLTYSGATYPTSSEASPPRDRQPRQDGFIGEHNQHHWQAPLESSPQFIGFASHSDTETALVSK